MINRFSACIVLTAACGVMTVADAAQPAQTAGSAHQQPATAQPLPAQPLPTLNLVGTVSAGGIRDHAILSIDGVEQVLYLQDAIGEGWWLDGIQPDHVLLTDERQVMRLDLLHSRPFVVSAALDSVIEPRAQPLEVHTLETHADLEPGQSRRFFSAPQEPAELPEDSLLAQWEHLQLEMSDPGMTRRFADGPAPEAMDREETAESLASGELAPGQSIRFGPEPLPDDDRLEEVPD